MGLSAMFVAFKGLIKSCFDAFDGQRALAGHCAAGEVRRGDLIRTTFYSSTFAGCPHEYTHTHSYLILLILVLNKHQRQYLSY